MISKSNKQITIEVQILNQTCHFLIKRVIYDFSIKFHQSS